MSQTNIQIDPLTTRCVLKNIGLAIEEIKLVRSINSLNDQLRLGNGVELDPGRRRYLVSELRFLRHRLTVLREKARTG